MKNIFKISKCGVVVILTICILLGIAGISVYATPGSEENTEEVIIQELEPLMARGCAYNLPANFLNGGRWTDDYHEIESHLIKYHGGIAISLSANLHSIKSFFGLPANYNCIFDMSGGVYSQNGELLGNLLNWK